MGSVVKLHLGVVPKLSLSSSSSSKGLFNVSKNFAVCVGKISLTTGSRVTLNTSSVAAIAEETAEEADECLQAKEMVVNSTTAQEFEFAKAKMSLLCDD